MTLLIVGGLFAVALLAMVAVYFVAQSEKQAELKKAAAAAPEEAEAAPQEAEAVVQPTPVVEEVSAQPAVEEVPVPPVVEQAATSVASSVGVEPRKDIYGANPRDIYGDNPNRERLRLSTELRSLHLQVQAMEQRLNVLNEMAQQIDGEPEQHYLVAVSEDEFERYDNSFDEEEEITKRIAAMRNPVTEDFAR